MLGCWEPNACGSLSGYVSMRVALTVELGIHISSAPLNECYVFPSLTTHVTRKTRKRRLKQFKAWRGEVNNKMWVHALLLVMKADDDCDIRDGGFEMKFRASGIVIKLALLWVFNHSIVIALNVYLSRENSVNWRSNLLPRLGRKMLPILEICREVR